MEQNTCPCDTVRQLRQMCEQHEKRLSDSATRLALIQQDVEYIKNRLDKKEKFNAGIAAEVLNIVLTILLGFLAIRMGIQ